MTFPIDANLALPVAILKACGIDPDTVTSFSLHCNTSGAHKLITRRDVWGVEPGDVRTISEHWQPAPRDE